MSATLLAVLLGLLASFLFALAAFLQQRAARTTASSGAVRRMARLVRDPAWLGGWSVNVGGFVAQAAALQVGSVAAVQPLLATQLLFVLLLAAAERRRRPRLVDAVAGAAICGGLVVLLVSVPVDAHGVDADRGRVVVAAVLLLGLALVGAVLARRLPLDARVVVLAAGAGLCFALEGVFIALTTDDLLRHGVLHTARDWVGYALAACTAVGLTLEQAAYAVGSLPWAVATKESVNPIAGFALGVLVFPVAVPGGVGTVVALVGAGVLLVLGAVLLARSPSSREWLRGSPDGVGAST